MVIKILLFVSLVVVSTTRFWFNRMKINTSFDFRYKHQQNRMPNQIHSLNQNQALWLNQEVWPRRIHFFSKKDLAVRKLQQKR